MILERDLGGFRRGGDFCWLCDNVVKLLRQNLESK
jgi:hypothetical protein